MAKIDIQKDWPDWIIGEPIDGGGFGTVYEMHREVFGEVERKALKVIYVPKDNTEVEFLRAEGLNDETISNTFYAVWEISPRNIKSWRSFAVTPTLSSVKI